MAYDLQLHCPSLQLNRADFEVHTDSAQVAVGERILCEPEEQAGLRIIVRKSIEGNAIS